MNLKDTYNKIAKDWVTDHNVDTWWQEGADYFTNLDLEIVWEGNKDSNTTNWIQIIGRKKA